MRRDRKKEYYRPGDNWVICDLSGLKVRRSDTVKQWNGLIVKRDWAEPRNPQDFVRGIHDQQTVPNPRPEPTTDSISGPLVTYIFEDFAAGVTAISVKSISGISSGDSVRVVMQGSTLNTTVATEGGGSATGGYHMTLASALTAPVRAGYPVTDLSVVTTATGGL